MVSWNRLGETLLIISFALGSIVLAPSSVDAQEPAVVRVVVDPPVGCVGTLFTVNVSVENVMGLVGACFNLTWDPSILEVVSMTEVLFHSATPEDDWGNIWSLRLTYNNTGGYAEYSQTWLNVPRAQSSGYLPFNGSQTMATLIFNGTSEGTTNLNLSHVVLGDLENRMPFTSVENSIIVDPPSTDINGDGSVDILDAITFSQHFGSKTGDPEWNYDVDFSGDGVIDIFDVIIFANDFG